MKDIKIFKIDDETYFKYEVTEYYSRIIEIVGNLDINKIDKYVEGNSDFDFKLKNDFWKRKEKYYEIKSIGTHNYFKAKEIDDKTVKVVLDPGYNPRTFEDIRSLDLVNIPSFIGKFIGKKLLQLLIFQKILILILYLFQVQSRV